eukprot:COSAG02_NODE_11206_length_1771_cov_2.104067_1_plen_44_part_10
MAARRRGPTLYPKFLPALQYGLRLKFAIESDKTSEQKQVEVFLL